MTLDAAQYWEARYRAGYTSGDGSYGDLAAFKAEVINAFVREHNIASVIEWGCGDGNQLTLAKYPRYLGIDVSPAAVEMCKARFRVDPSKAFILADSYQGETAEIALSLDTIFHLTDTCIYNTYMCMLYNSATRYVIVYASDTDQQQPGQSPHMCHHCHSAWVQANAPAWQLLGRIPNRYPERSVSDFAIYGRI